ENAVKEIIKGVYRASRGSGSAKLEIYKEEDLKEEEDKIRSRVYSIATFQATMEPVQVQIIEFSQDVVNIALGGTLPWNALTPIAKEI
ncbi:hypothetical protein, partial [Pseudoalteromonas piscicida]|uniref:hypothetical protein n=1 Tax=Pseudoalteromonas piscicida TaxID=43662 RepID=UPI00110A7BA3